MTYSNWIRASRRMASLAVAALFAVGLAACDDGVSGPDDSTLSVQMTDGDGTVEAVWVEVTELRVVGQSGQGGGSITVLDESSGLIRLSPDNVETLVSEAAIPSGTYGQIRMVIGGAVLETEDGGVFTKDGAQHPESLATTGDLICPSCDETGIAIVPPGGALRLDAESKVLVLDFDVHQSFEAGASGQWAMSPVILATELQLSGGIAGQVHPGAVQFPVACGGDDRTIEDFVPQAESQDDAGVLKTGTVETDAEGNASYAINFVQAGDWTMTFDDRVEFNGETLVFTLDENSPDPASVTVEEGQTSTADYTLASATCETG